MLSHDQPTKDMQDSLVVWGAGGHAKVVSESLRRLDRWQLAGFIDELSPHRAGETFGGALVLGGREVLSTLLSQGVTALVLAFGNNAQRLRLWRELGTRGFHFPTIVDVHAVVADDVELGQGCYIAAGAVIQPGARLGSQVIVNTGAIVEHDCSIGDGVHLSPRVCLCGQVTVGEGTWIGAGALVRDHVQVGANVMVGMGSVVVRDLRDGVLAYGHPCEPRREVRV